MDNPGWRITSVVIAAIAILGGLAKWIHWMGGINEHKNGVGRVLDEIRADIKKICSGCRPPPPLRPARAVLPTMAKVSATK